MKFDMSAAWSEVTRLLSANRQVLLIVAGVFFFLPSVIYGLVFNSELAGLEAAQAGEPDLEAMTQGFARVFGQYWWILLLTTIVQWFGTLAMLVLLTDRSRPTVGQALGSGLRLLLPYLGAQILMSCVFGILLLLPFAIAASAGTGAGVLVGFLALVALIYLYTKFLLVAPAVATEGIVNPMVAIGRSWRLTKGNSLRLFLFVFLLAVAFIVVGGVASMIAGLAFALAGSDAALVGDAIISGLVNALFTAIFVAAVAAAYRQLAGPAPATVSETFS
ncbi:glycerophosphoryl diester phosphodiesterase membrane domain-containing protein [Tsuneonella sp. HG249]